MEARLASSETEPRRMAILVVPKAALHRLLGLPPDAEIISCRCPYEFNDVLEIKVSGAGWKVCPSDILPRFMGYERSPIAWDCPPWKESDGF
jgi:hypothetical protein